MILSIPPFLLAWLPSISSINATQTLLSWEEKDYDYDGEYERG